MIYFENFQDNNLDNIVSHTVKISNSAAAISSNDADILSISNDVAAATRCTGILNSDINCCTSANPCGINQGDCDYDYECSGDLRCGTDNCIGQGFPSSYDCCILDVVWFDAWRYVHFINISLQSLSW